jgi:hypothetical protein
MKTNFREDVNHTRKLISLQKYLFLLRFCLFVCAQNELSSHRQTCVCNIHQYLLCTIIYVKFTFE